MPVSTTLAPDGLPWPKGYSDRPPRQTLEEAVAMYGVRPSCYLNGRPGYTLEETCRPEFKVKLPDEPLAVQQAWRKEWNAKENPVDAALLRGEKSAVRPRKAMDIFMLGPRPGFSDYPRPCVILRVEPDGSAWVVMLSTKDLYPPGQAFCVDKSHPDFAATGLSVTCYSVEPLRWIPADRLG